MDRREAGFTVMSFGIMFFIIGATLLADKAMAVSGNILIIIGASIFTGPRVTDFLSFNKVQGMALFILGVFFLLKAYVLMGFLLEILGLLVLILDRIPTPKSVIRKVATTVWRAS